jgi:hypothetical protein
LAPVFHLISAADKWLILPVPSVLEPNSDYSFMLPLCFVPPRSQIYSL